MRQWLDEVANRRQHRETGQSPEERFRVETLRSLPALNSDYRDTAEVVVHKDLRLHFDGNRYCVPPPYVGRKLTVKADSSSVTIYDQHHEIVRYARCWQRGQTFGAERFQGKELSLGSSTRSAPTDRSAAQQRLVVLLGPVPLEEIPATVGGYGSIPRPASPRTASPDPRLRPGGSRRSTCGRPMPRVRFGADYIANILRQQQSRREVQPPLRLKDPELNQLATDPLSLAEYDAFILRSQKESRDVTSHGPVAERPLEQRRRSGGNPHRKGRS